MRQFDIFSDSRGTELVNAVVDALLARDAQGANAALERLVKEQPQSGDVGSLETLCRFIRERDAVPVPQAVERLEAEIVPASAALGAEAGRFLGRAWRELAERAGEQYDPAHPELHPAALLLRAGEPARAERAAAAIPGGDRISEVLRWRCLAGHPLGGLDAALPMLLRFAWLAPERFAALVCELGDPMLESAWRGFNAALGELDATWFPAWFLHEHPGTAILLDGVPGEVPGAAAFAIVARLLPLEKQGHSTRLVGERARLKSQGASFYGFYLSRRSVGRP